MPDEYALFLNQPGPDAPEATYLVSPAIAPPITGNGGDIFWDNGLWRMRQATAHRFDIEVHDAQMPGGLKAAEMASDFSTGLLFPSPVSVRAGLPVPFHHPQDRAIVLGRFCHLGGVMIHSSCVLVEDKVLLFFGMSGAGKTTIARLWRGHGATILNDERNLIRVRSDAVWAGASPWHGEENQVSSAVGPLAGIFYLKQSTTNPSSTVVGPES